MKRKILSILGIVSLLAISSCNKKVEFYADPYEEGKPALGVILESTQTPVPSIGGPGTVVKFKVSGLEQYKDRAVFSFNGQKAEVVSLTADEITVKVPAFASSGVTSINIDDVVIFGPTFYVQGKIQIDPSWQALIGTNNHIASYLNTQDEKTIFVGAFTNYENRGLVKPINRLVRTYGNGTYDVTWRTGNGANGSVNSIIQIGTYYYLSGGFSGYDQRRDNISNLTRINLQGQIDTMPVKPFRRPDQTDTTKYYPKFNGGFDRFVNKIYEHNGKVLAVGDFQYHIHRVYGKPNFMETKDSVILDSTAVRSVARLKLDGTLDSTYRFVSGKFLPGANGSVGSYLHENGSLKGKLLVFGGFNRFDNNPAGYITRLNVDGTVDASFNAGGAGASFKISSANYNEKTGKYVLTGTFRTFNGIESPKMVVLNSDGKPDTEFKVKDFGTGAPYYAKQLDDGLIVVNGDFVEYNGIRRNRFLILNSKGDLDPNLNSIGQFGGSISEVIETKSDDGRRALLIIGSFNRFDTFYVNNIIRVVIE